MHATCAKNYTQVGNVLLERSPVLLSRRRAHRLRSGAELKAGAPHTRCTPIWVPVVPAVRIGVSGGRGRGRSGDLRVRAAG